MLWLSCSNLDQYNGRRIWFKSSPVRIAHSDSSDTGYGSYVVELGAQVASVRRLVFRHSESKLEVA